MNHKYRKHLRNYTVFFALLVVFFTLLTLSLPALTLTSQDMTLACSYGDVHSHDDSCYRDVYDEDGHVIGQELYCGKLDYCVHEHDDSCYEEINGEKVLVCQLPEVKEHRHNASCYEEFEVLVCGKEESEDHQHDASCYETKKKLICGQAELHQHDASCYEEGHEGDADYLICGKWELLKHVHDDNCFKERKAEAGSEKKIEKVGETAAIKGVSDTSEESGAIETSTETKESGIIEASESEEKTETKNIDTENPSIEGGIQTFEAATDNVSVQVIADEGALPAETRMTLRDIGDKNTLDVISDAVEGEIEKIQAVDISFISEGKEVEPLLPVKVIMTSSVEEEREAQVVHLADDGTAQIVEKTTENLDIPDDAVVFEADTFSVYALVYTVDFHYEINGNTYDFSIPGGGFIALSDVVNVLGIAGNVNTVQTFMADVEKVEFSNPELVSITKIEKDTTVGGIKDSFGLKCEYSAKLTDKQIEQINATKVIAGDWALISLKAFTSEESLIVTMKNGDVFKIRVTDDQEYRIYFIVNNILAGTLTAAQVNRGVSYNENSKGMHIPRGIIANNNENYRYVFWVKDDGTIAKTRSNNILDESNSVDRETTFIACFAPSNAKIAIIKPFDTSKGSVSGGLLVDDNTALPQYLHSNSEKTTLTASPASGYFFKGWYVDGECVSTERQFDVSSISKDIILEPVFSPWPSFTIMTNGRIAAGNEYPGHFSSFGNRIYDGDFYAHTREAFRDSSGSPYVGYNVETHADEGYRFAYWLKDDGSQLPTRSNGSILDGSRVFLDRDTTYIGFFSPKGEHIVRLNWPEPGTGSVDVVSGDVPRSVTGETNDRFSFLYYFSGDGSTITATPAEGYEFLGWYDNYNAETGRGTLISTELSYNTAAAARDLNLTPVFEGDVNHRDYYNVWFDGTNGLTASAVAGTDIAHGANTMFARKDGSGNVHGAESVWRGVSQSEAVITLPTADQVRRPQGYGYNDFTLYGWYMLPAGNSKKAVSGADGIYYAPGETVTITRDTVFYADWFAGSYDIGQDEKVFTSKGTVIYPDTSSFIRTDMYDYNTLFNMESLLLDSDSHISRIGNYEYWKRNTNSRDFLFISAISDEMRTLSPRERKTDWRNQNHEISREGDIYAGIVSQGILNTERLQDDLFGTTDSLGKKYIGRGDNLYLYDTSNGYYYYDSDKNAASYNKSAQRFYVYDYKNATDKSNSQGGNDGADFLPFNYGERVYTESYGEPNYWFGMKSEINFFLPNPTGYTDSNDITGNRSNFGDEMVFKFCGDDDVWIFVDDVLYLDLGGVHGKVFGEINFSRGTTTIAHFGAKKIDDENIMTYSVDDSNQTGEDSVVGGPAYNGDHRLVIPGTIDLSEGDHKVTIYYLERGSSQSNCAIYFNLAPRYSLQLEKKDSDTNEKLEDAVFGIYADADCTLSANLTDSNGAVTNIFRTDDQGKLWCTGLVAGRTYYLKELISPEGYPDMSDEVLTLTISSSGNPQVSSTADAGNGWQMAAVTSSEAENSTSKGLFTFYLTVNNKRETSVSVRKTWQKADGSAFTPSGDSKVTVQLKRYYLSEENASSEAEPSPEAEASSESVASSEAEASETSQEQGNSSEPEKNHYTVRLIERYFSDGEKPVNDDTKQIKVSHINTQTVEEGGSISFDVTADDPAGIYSVVAQPGSGTAAASHYTTGAPFVVNGGRMNLPQAENFTLSNIAQDTNIYITFIGDMDNENRLGACTEVKNVSITTSGGTSYARIQDEVFNRVHSYTEIGTENSISTEQILKASNDWQFTWTGLDTSGDHGTWYYYIEETNILAAESDTTSVKWSNSDFSTTYSSYGLSSGTIKVVNTLNAVKVKLRKKDAQAGPDNQRVNLPGAVFKIFTEEEYERAQENGIPINRAEYGDLLESGTSFGEDDGITLTSNEAGCFYTGYLPLGTYYILETQAPAGYNKLTEPIKVMITENGLSYLLDGRTYRRSLDKDGYYNLFIDNTAGYELPSTGGTGVTVFYMIGGILAAGAAIIWIFKKTESIISCSH